MCVRVHNYVCIHTYVHVLRKMLIINIIMVMVRIFVYQYQDSRFQIPATAPLGYFGK